MKFDYFEKMVNTYMSYTPPFYLTSRILSLVAKISEILGVLSATHFSDSMSPRLRRSNTIKTVQASCAIEGNELTIEQVTAILEGKTVVGAPREIQEIKNALDLYEAIDSSKVLHGKVFLKLMKCS